MEDITDEIREWFVVWYNALGHYDVFPAADVGGSVLIVTGQTLTPQEYLLEKLEKEKKAKGKRAERMALFPEAESIKTKVPGSKMPQTDALSCLNETNIEFIRNWSFRKETNSEQEYLDLITEKLGYELQLEMREIVDELMRAELELLNEALLKDHAYDKEKFTIPTMDKSEMRTLQSNLNSYSDNTDKFPLCNVAEIYYDIEMLKLLQLRCSVMSLKRLCEIEAKCRNVCFDLQKMFLKYYGNVSTMFVVIFSLT